MKQIEKKKYEIPSMKVFTIVRRAQILAGSGEGSAGGEDPEGDGVED